MLIPDNIIHEALRDVIDILIDKYDDLDMRASGRWADSLEIRTSGSTSEIWGESYTEQLTKGREPSNKMPPVQKIYKWMHDKRNFSGEKTLSRAYAIATNIKKFGTSWYQKGGSDLLEVLEREEVQNLFFEKIGEYVKVEIQKDLVRNLKEI